MQFFHDTETRQRISTGFWNQLRVVDPSILPWKLGGKTTDINLHVLQSDYFFQRAYFQA
jgi:hypothetical protein